MVRWLQGKVSLAFERDDRLGDAATREFHVEREHLAESCSRRLQSGWRCAAPASCSRSCRDGVDDERVREQQAVAHLTAHRVVAFRLYFVGAENRVHRHLFWGMRHPWPV